DRQCPLVELRRLGLEADDERDAEEHRRHQTRPSSELLPQTAIHYLLTSSLVNGPASGAADDCCGDRRDSLLPPGGKASVASLFPAISGFPLSQAESGRQCAHARDGSRGPRRTPR